MSDSLLQTSLDELRTSIHTMSTREQWHTMHRLAEAGYMPAITFFLDCFDDADPRIREFAVECLGFHYDLSQRMDALDRLRSILLVDDDDDVRLAAAAALGSQLRWTDNLISDEALIITLTTDKDEHVRYAAFRALLAQKQMASSIIATIDGWLKSGQIAPTIEELDRLLQEWESGCLGS